MQKISVLLPNIFSICTYFASQNVEAGSFVRVSFGRSEIIGVVWDAQPDEDFPEEKKTLKGFKWCQDRRPLHVNDIYIHYNIKK